MADPVDFSAISRAGAVDPAKGTVTFSVEGQTDYSHGQLGVGYDETTAFQPDRGLNVSTMVANALAGTAVSFVDTIGQSVGLFDEDTISSALQENGLMEFGTFYENQRENLDMASSVAGVLLPGMLGIKMLRASQAAVRGGKFGETLKDSASVRALLGGGQKFSDRLDDVRRTASSLQQSRGTFAGGDFGIAKLGERSLQSVRKDAVLQQTLQGAREGLAAELAIYGLMNESQTLFPDEFSTADNLAWASLGVVLPAGIEFAFSRKAVRDTIKSVAKGAGPTLEAAGLSAQFLAETTFRPQMRGVGVSLFAEGRNLTESALSYVGDSRLVGNLNNDLTQFDEVLFTQLKNLGGDTNIALGRSVKIDQATAEHLHDSLREDSFSFLNAVKFDNVQGTFEDFSKKMVKKLDNIVVNETETIKSLLAKGPLSPKDRKAVHQAQLRIDEATHFKKAEYTVVENNGDLTLYANRPEKWLDEHSFKDIRTKNEASGTVLSINIADEGALGLDDAFNSIIPRPATRAGQVQNRANFTRRVLPGERDAIDNQITTLITRAFAPGEAMGVRYLQKMRPESSSIMRSWTGGGMRKLRSIESAGDKDGVLMDIYQAGDEMRAALREMHYVQTYGTVPLYRGESPTASVPGKGPASDLASFTTSRKVAEAFAKANGGSVVRKEVLVDDIVAVAGLQGEREFIVRNNKTRRYSMDAGGIEEVGIASLSYKRMSALQAIASKQIENVRQGKGKENIIAKGASWFTLDAQLEAMSVAGEEGAQLFKFGAGFKRIEDVEFDVLAGKYERFVELLEGQAKQKEMPAFAKSALSREQIIDMLNLPHDMPGGRPAPIVDLFYELYAQGDRDFRAAFLKNADALGIANRVPPLDLVKRAMNSSLAFPNVPGPVQSFKLRGHQLRQKDIKPVLVQNIGVPLGEHTSRELVNMAAYQRARQLNAIGEARKKGHLLVAASTESMLGTAAFDLARKVDELAPEGVLSGAGRVVQQARIEDQDVVLKALSDLVQFSERTAVPVIEEYMKPVVDNLTKLRSQKHRDSLINFNRIEQAYRYGWDIAGATPQPDGTYRFLLADTNRNKRLWESAFGPKIKYPETAYLPGMTKTELEKGYVPLTVDEIAASTAMQINSISRRIGEETNFIRQSQGMKPIKLRDFHLPSPELNRENMWVVYNEQGKVVSTFSGATPDAGRINAERFIKEQTAKGDRQLRVHSWEEVQRYHGIHADDFQEFIDYSDAINQTGYQAKGTLFSSVIDSTDGTLNNLTGTLSNNLTSIAARSRAMLFEPQINQARLMHQASGGNKNELTIWERYVNTIYGGATQTPRSAVGAVYRSVETVFDNFLNAQYDKVAATYGSGARAEIVRNDPSKLLNFSKREYDNYAKQAGEQDIFGSVEKFMRDTHKVTTPPALRKILLAANQTAGTLMYRFLDVGSGVLNLSSVMTNAAPVIRAVGRGADEELDAWRQRTGAYSSRVGSEFRTFNPVKALTTTMFKWNTPEFQQVIARAEKMGMFQPEFVAMNKILNEPMESLTSSKMRQFTDAASYMADASEMLSRKISWGLGYNIATDVLKIADERDAMLFAMRFENDMIGDYRPQNRPQIFQGALGLPLGMFQTYMFNFYRRLYGYMERKDMTAIASQYASQASVFGLTSLPGWNEFSTFFYSNYDGTHNPVDMIQQNYDEDFADLILYGSVSNIPKIFGQDGLSLYTRGNANLNAPPTPFSPDRSPVWGFAKQIFEGSRASVDQFLKGGEFSRQQTAELLATFSVNRPIQGLIELGLGYETDRRGQIVDADTRDTMGYISRMMGTNELSVQKQKEAMYRVRSTELTHRSIRERMRNSARSLFRDGEVSVDDLRSLAQNYIDSGGDMGYFPTWLRDNALAATSPKAALKLEELAKSSDYQNFMRLLSVMQPDLSSQGD